jgi:hypothetical protein
LIFGEKVSPFSELIDGLYACIVEFLGLARTYPPNFAELSKNDVLFRALKFFQFGNLARLEELFDFI